MIVGKNQGSAIGALVERQTRFVRLVRVPSREADSFRVALTAAIRHLPTSLAAGYASDGELTGHLTVGVHLPGPRRGTRVAPWLMTRPPQTDSYGSVGIFV